MHVIPLASYSTVGVSRFDKFEPLPDADEEDNTRRRAASLPPPQRETDADAGGSRRYVSRAAVTSAARARAARTVTCIRLR